MRRSHHHDPHNLVNGNVQQRPPVTLAGLESEPLIFSASQSSAESDADENHLVRRSSRKHPRHPRGYRVHPSHIVGMDWYRRTWLPARYTFALLACCGFMLVYAYKVVLSVVITVMVVGSQNDSSLDTECLSDYSNDSDVITRSDLLSSVDTDLSTESAYQFHWTDSDRGLALGAYFYGYVVTQIPAGRLSEIVGSKWLFGGTNLIAASVSLLLPMAARWGIVPFVVCRIAQGLSAGMAFPVMNSMIARWTPKSERSLMSTIVYTGSHLGTVITLPLAGALSSGKFLDGWPAVFYVLGLLGILWFVAWALLIYETPADHPFIREAELAYISADQGEEKTTKNPPIPLKEILTSLPVWALVITHFCNNWGFLTILTEQPTYFQKVLRMDVRKNGILSSLPYLCCAICGWISGYINDRARRSGRIPISVLRKVSNSISFFGPALCLVGITLVKCDTTATVILFAIALGCNGASFSGFMVTHVDMAPDYAGSLMGLTNTIANFTGFITPLVVEAFTSEKQTLAAWRSVFLLSAGVFSFGAIVYILFATADLQPWGIASRNVANGGGGGETAGTGDSVDPERDASSRGRSKKKLSTSRKHLVYAENT